METGKVIKSFGIAVPFLEKALPNTKKVGVLTSFPYWARFRRKYLRSSPD